MAPSGSPYLLSWATEELQALTTSCRSFTAKTLQSLVVDELLKRSPVHSILSATALPMKVSKWVGRFVSKLVSSSCLFCQLY